MKKIIFCVFCLFVTTLSACKEKFSKAGWTDIEDVGIYPHRNNMIDDLTKNYKLKGLSYKQLVNLLGEPANSGFSDSSSAYYDIVVDYGHDIDPVYVKVLNFYFNKDSIITKYSIQEFKH